MTDSTWDRAAALPAVVGVRRPQLATLPPGLPTTRDLFTFMRDAELRFRTLRLKLEERTFTARGEHLVTMDLALAHPGRARVLTAEPEHGPAGAYEVWLSDGQTVRTWSGIHRLATERPVRPRPRGFDGSFPGSARLYEPLTALPMETLPELFVHPANYCQNVLASGTCWVAGSDEVAGREAIVIECDHPRAIERVADRSDFHLQVAADRATGVISRLVETIGGEVTREAVVTALEPDATLPPGIFELAIPADADRIF
jgi:hypothetical protein